MKKFIITSIMLILLTISMYNFAEAAKPGYCWEALDRCLNYCDRIFSTPILQDACSFGCYIGFEKCG